MVEATKTGGTTALRLELISPERVLVDRPVRSLQIPAEDGMLGVMKNHAALVTPIVAGVLTVEETDGNRHRFAVGSGFLEVADNRARVMVDSAEHPDQIDVDRARRALERARERLAKRGVEKDIDFLRAEASMRRAIARLKVTAQL